MGAKDRVRVRGLERKDVKQAVAIERRVTRSRRDRGLARNLRARLTGRGRSVCLAATVGGRLAGFLVGEVRPFEFGERERVGWIEVVGVDPDFQGRGIGRALGKEALRRFRKGGVRRVRTLVGWDSSDMIAYFATLGFERGDEVLLEVALEGRRGR